MFLIYPSFSHLHLYSLVLPSPYLLIRFLISPCTCPSSLHHIYSSIPTSTPLLTRHPFLPSLLIRPHSTFLLTRFTLYLSPNPSFPPFFLPLLIRSPFSLLLITHPSFFSLFSFIFLFTHPSSRPFLPSVRPLFHYPSFLPSRTQFILPFFLFSCNTEPTALSSYGRNISMDCMQYNKLVPDKPKQF